MSWSYLRSVWSLPIFVLVTSARLLKLLVRFVLAGSKWERAYLVVMALPFLIILAANVVAGSN